MFLLFGVLLAISARAVRSELRGYLDAVQNEDGRGRFTGWAWCDALLCAERSCASLSLSRLAASMLRNQRLGHGHIVDC